jgi:hypothetical protein
MRRAGELHPAPDAELRGADRAVYDPADSLLAVALIVVFYVSQPNVLMIKLVSVVFCHRQRRARRRAADHQVDL